MWELNYTESWPLKNWCFWTVVLEKTLESPLDCKEIQPVHSKGDQSILKEISPGHSLEGLMLKLKLQYFGHLMRRIDSLERTLMLGGIGGRRRRDGRGWDGWMTSLTRWTWVWVNSRSWFVCFNYRHHTICDRGNLWNRPRRIMMNLVFLLSILHQTAHMHCLKNMFATI